MKGLLLYSKNLEYDFPNDNASYQSKIDLGVSSLVTNNFTKAKDLFDSTIELDSNFPSGCIGKSFDEIAGVSDEDFNSINIDEYVERSWKNGGEKLENYKVVLFGCLDFRHFNPE